MRPRKRRVADSEPHYNDACRRRLWARVPPSQIGPIYPSACRQRGHRMSGRTRSAQSRETIASAFFVPHNVSPVISDFQTCRYQRSSTLGGSSDGTRCSVSHACIRQPREIVRQTYRVASLRFTSTRELADIAGCFGTGQFPAVDVACRPLCHRLPDG